MNALPPDVGGDPRLVRSGEVRPPYDFAEFRRRAGRPLHTLPVRAALAPRQFAVAASLVAVVVAAVLWRWVAVPTPAGTVAVPALQAVTAYSEAVSSDREALQDRIAWLDDVLSEGRVSGAKAESLAAIERSRTLMVDSLQRVSYAQQLVEQ